MIDSSPYYMPKTRNKTIDLESIRKKDEKFLETDHHTDDNRNSFNRKRSKPLTKQEIKEREYVLKRNKEIAEMKENRDRPSELFGLSGSGQPLTLKQMVDESERRMNGISYKPDYKDDWQANIWDPVTRNKFLAIIARLSAQRMKAFFYDDEGFGMKIARIFNNMFERRARGKNGRGNDVVLLFDSMFNAALHGTVIIRTGYRDGRRRVKSQRKKDGKWKYKTLFEWEDTWSDIIPIMSYIPGEVNIPNAQSQTRCALEEELNIDEFKDKYRDYDKIHLVDPLSKMSDSDISHSSLGSFNRDDSVIVREYYNYDTDSFDVIANNILLTKIDNPLPYKHKQLPFVSAKHELINTNFFYGLSLPFKLANWNDMTNATWNMALDQMMIALKSPIFNATGNDIEMNWMYPSSVIDLPAGSNLNQVREFQVQSQAGPANAMLQSLYQRIDQTSSVSAESNGISGQGRSKTAEEVATAREASLDIMGLFLRQMELLETDRVEQVCQVMIEKYPQRLKSTGKHRTFIIDDIRLLNGEIGKMKINIREKPRKKEVLNKFNLETDEKSQVVDIDPSVITNFKAMVKIIPNSSVKETEDQKKSAELKWFEMTKESPLINQQANIKDLAEAFGKDISLLMAKEDNNGPSFDNILGELQKKSPSAQAGLPQRPGSKPPTPQ